MYEFLQETVADNMTRSARSVAPEMTVGDLYRLFASDDYDAYPVLRDDVVVGFVTKLDALKVFAFTPDQMLPHYDDRMGTTVDEIMSCDVIAVEPDTNLQRVLHLMVSHRLKSLPVIDKYHQLVGIIAREDIMRALARCTKRQAPPLVPCETVRCLRLA
ncbi:CBS domain-containing protein [Bradyrhizobium jicamae]|uniref:CBS domain-containing protein n=1 Tax=Bradyrhizobium jicamae TaxID=280332 RepID=A0ABS5FDZ0_9BRAD|nr:CBS domain-containing protein [Bradyrhizobium jicamae]MBR0795000.1 CBS domain-containing protein [Bradyrhizobium jicamae]MBR0934230.1 CBS domain-containing protein [Bradyrhizobium jicamae]